MLKSFWRESRISESHRWRVFQSKHFWLRNIFIFVLLFTCLTPPISNPRRHYTICWGNVLANNAPLTLKATTSIQCNQVIPQIIDSYKRLSFILSPTLSQLMHVVWRCWSHHQVNDCTRIGLDEDANLTRFLRSGFIFNF